MNFTVLIGAMGYFVDLFDLSIFAVLRSPSLKELGFGSPSELLEVGVQLYNWQMVGMLLGGLFWGWMADKKGRRWVLIGSIFIYSIASLLNAGVSSLEGYVLCRFISGFGLAGELGAAVTLVMESLPSKDRGLGAALVASMGLIGVVCASLVGSLMPWRAVYVLGGLMGFTLLVLRGGLRESTLFQESKAPQGYIFEKKEYFINFLLCIFLGAPIYFVTGVIFTFAPELLHGLGATEVPTVGDALLFGSLGMALGDLVWALVSQRMQSRKRPLIIAKVGLALLLFTLRYFPSKYLFFGIGLFVGYWVLIVAMSVELFGIKLRGFVATLVPNIVRATAILSTSLFVFCKTKWTIGIAVALIFGAWLLLSFLSLALLPETYHRNWSRMDS